MKEKIEQFRTTKTAFMNFGIELAAQVQMSEVPMTGSEVIRFCKEWYEKNKSEYRMD